MANIYQISQELLGIFDELEDNGGELTPELEEALNITQEEFRSKIKSYSDVIKMLESDIVNIKAEKARLNDLQKSKEKTIERLKKIIAEAVETFGDTTKTGGKFIDFGTGKVSVRTTQSVEVETDSINRAVGRLLTYLSWYNINNQLDAGIVTKEDLLLCINTATKEEEDNDIDPDIITEKDLERITASITLDIDVNRLISDKTGINLIKALLDYNVFKLEAKADKKGIKDDAKSDDHYVPSYAKIVNNKSVTIK